MSRPVEDAAQGLDLFPAQGDAVVLPAPFWVRCPALSPTRTEAMGAIKYEKMPTA